MNIDRIGHFQNGGPMSHNTIWQNFVSKVESNEVITNSHFLRWIFILTSRSLLNNSSKWAKCCKSPLLCIRISSQEICPFENMVHYSLKEDRCILQSKRHHKPFLKLIASMECYFLAILCNNHNMVETLPQIHNCENVWISNAIK